MNAFTRRGDRCLGAAFRQRQGDSWYVEEEIRNPASPAPWQLQGKTHHGWWQNSWQRWTQEENQKMVCRLAGTAEENAFLPDLRPADGLQYG